MAAAKVVWDRKLKLDQSCRLCRRPDYAATREVWGCDGDAPAPIFTLDCWDCAPRPDPECARCAGTGKVAWLKCPRGHIDPAAFAAVRAVDLACEMHILPSVGGWDDQHPSFQELFWLLIQERGKYLPGDPAAPQTKTEPRHDPHPPLDRDGYLRCPGG